MCKNKKMDAVAIEDLHWLEIVRRAVDGTAAIAEANAEGCSTEWMAMQYSLESTKDIIDSIIKDYRERLGLGQKPDSKQ